jgi:Fic-DOC domain mobile mystery protein B
MTLLVLGEGNTPLTPDEQADLIPSLGTKEELNEFESLNILEAYSWALDHKNIRRNDVLSEPYLRDLHRRMFDQTWRWAGTYRATERNLGIAHYLIREQIGVLLGDTQYWIGNTTFSADEICVRFHHRLVSIHPFPNGNGRHSRLMADVLATSLATSPFSWGGASITEHGTLRESYISALRAADSNNIAPLLIFARS